VRADIEQQDNLIARSGIGFEREDYPAIITTGAGPKPKKLATQFVCTQVIRKNIIRNWPRVSSMRRCMILFRRADLR
jgi:hypothetical protein